MTTRIVLAEDHALVREGIGNLLREVPDLEIVGEAADGRAAVDRTLEVQPDVVLMDVGLPELNGVEATRRIKAARPSTLVLALSVHSDRRFVQSMLEAGASGYMLKDGPLPELLEAIRSILDGRIFLSPRIARLAGPGDTRSAPPLSVREREVLAMLADGRSNQEIADRLGLSRKTIETHRAKIIRKLGIRSIAELTKYAVRVGLTPLGE